MPDMITIMKRAAMEAVEAQKPAALTLGTVESENPLEIRVEQKFRLRASQLIIPRSLTEYDLEIGILLLTDAEGEPAHAHRIAGENVVRVKNALKVGETVMLLRMQGGQKYMILDRVVEG